VFSHELQDIETVNRRALNGDRAIGTVPPDAGGAAMSSAVKT